MRTIPTVITALCIAACSLPATAGVVYNWVELEGNPELGPMTGHIEIKDKVEVWQVFVGCLQRLFYTHRLARGNLREIPFVLKTSS